jgi:predicted DNA-binding transcriptional regulator AlpA
MDKLMDVKAAAAYLGLSVSFLEHARGKGTGPPFYKIGQRVLYSPKDIDAWLASKRSEG